MFDVRISYEAQNSMDKIAKEFRGRLSETEINKTAAAALNITTRRILAKIVKDAQKDFTITGKYMERTAKMKPAGRDRSNLYTTLSYARGVIPAVGYKYSPVGSRGGIRIEVRKGKAEILRHAFVATMKSGHKGIWVNGHYSNNKLVPGGSKLTEVKSPSPFGMYTNERMNQTVYKYIDENLTKRFAALLQNKVNKLSK